MGKSNTRIKDKYKLKSEKDKSNNEILSVNIKKELTKNSNFTKTKKQRKNKKYNETNKKLSIKHDNIKNKNALNFNCISDSLANISNNNNSCTVNNNKNNNVFDDLAIINKIIGNNIYLSNPIEAIKEHLKNTINNK